MIIGARSRISVLKLVNDDEDETHTGLILRNNDDDDD